MTGHLLVTLCLLVVAASALPGGLLPRRRVAVEPSKETPSTEAPSTPAPSTDTPYTKPTDIPPTMPASCAERPEVNDYLMIVDPLTCTRFIVCDGPRETTMSCPAGLYFNYVQQYCDWPENSGCAPRPGLPSTTEEYITVTVPPATDATRAPPTDATRAPPTDATRAPPTNAPSTA